MKPDKETVVALEDGRQALLITKSEDWNYLKDVLNEKILKLKEVDIELDDTRFAQEMKSNYKAANVLEEFISEVEGKGTQYKDNKELLSDMPDLYNRT